MGSLIIGCGLGYSLATVRPWIHTLREYYKGDVVLFTMDMPSQGVSELENQYDVMVSDVSKSSLSSPPHVARFELLHDFLVKSYYSHIITTDVRDVVFQADPMPAAENSGCHLYISREWIKYKDEPWGKRNIEDTLGQKVANTLMDETVANVGVFGGSYVGVLSAFGYIDRMCKSINPNAIMDQAIYNYFLTIPIVEEKIRIAFDDEAWCINLGTTKHAVEAGAGDIGVAFQRGLVNINDYGYLEEQPIIKDGVVRNAYNEKEYAIVHQWDRVPELRKRYKQLVK